MKTEIYTYLFGSGVIAIFLAFLIFNQMPQAEGSAFTGTNAFLQIATTTAVGPQDGEDTIFASNETCKARIVTTQGMTGGIMISFGDKTNGDFSSTTLSGQIGHYQAPSTTIAYDSGLYGCGRWTAYSHASQTISISEF